MQVPPPPPASGFGVFDIALQLTVCPDQTPLSLAGVNALINGYTATNLTLPLAPIPSSGFYGAKLDTNILFPDLVRPECCKGGLSCEHSTGHGRFAGRQLSL